MGKAIEHLSVSERERIAESLFTVDSRRSRNKSELMGLCPVHDEKTPSFSYNVEKDACLCFGCGFRSDLIGLWCQVKGYGKGSKEGFKAFCKEYNISDSLSPVTAKRTDTIEPLDVAYGKLGNLPDDWITKLSRLRGWSPSAMSWLGLRQQTHFQKKDTGQIVKIRKNPDRVAIPIYGDDKHIWNIRLYKPLGRSDNDKMPKIMSWGTKYGDSRLFPPSPRESGTVILCEGEPDTICAISHGFNAITQTGKNKKWKKKDLRKFEDRDVVIAFDADQAGVMYAKEYAAPELYKVAKTVRIIEWPDFMGKRDDGEWPEKHGQDLTDFFVKHRKTEVDLQALIEEADYFEPPDTPIDPKAFRFFARGMNDRLSFKSNLLAKQILEDYKLLSCPDTGLLYRWNGRFWEEFNEDHLSSVALKMLGKEAQKSRVQDAVFQAQKLSTIPHGRALNDKEDWICVKNGMLNIDTLELESHDPDFFASYELGVVFNPDSKKKCKRWIQFLKETVQTPEVIKQVQEFFGYCFLKRTPFAKCLLVLGPGADGKSKLFNILQAMVGEENCAAITFDEMEDQFLRSSLYQKSVNICGEVGSKIIESTYFKAVTAGDRVNAAFKHKNAFTFRPYCKVLFAGNKMPRVKDTSDGLYRRLLPVQFKRQFMEGDPDTDPDLESKLLDELSEIFVWSLIGLKRLLKNKRFTQSDETDEIMMNYKRLNNPVLCFVQDECELKEGGQETKDDIYKRYDAYCRNGKYFPCSRENFFKELKAAYESLKTFRPRRNNPGRKPYIKGLQLRSGGDS